MSAPKQNKDIYILAAVVICVALYQLLFILSLHDGDTDAYAHFIISRDIIRSPYNLSLHWVWLPLFHYIGAFFVLVGTGLEPIRFLNLIIWNSIPFIFFIYLKRKHESTGLPLIASVLTALFPVGILMGTTAQPEPLFTLLILLFAVFYESEKYILSGLMLSAACMLRYEAWAVLLGISILFLIRILKQKSLYVNAKKSLLIYLNIILPVFFILLWSFLRYLSEGEWFSFLHGTQKFANDALGESHSMQGGVLKFLNDLFFYPLWIPVLFSGAAALLIPFGIKKFFMENRIMFVISISILAFITLSWVLKSNLGLNRHFTAVIPYYSLLIACGYASASQFLKKFRIFSSGKILAIVFTSVILFYTTMWLYIWWKSNSSNFIEKLPAIEYLKEINSREPESIIVCNDPMVEVLSGINFTSFNHFWMESNEPTKKYILSLKTTDSKIYVVASAKDESYFSAFLTKVFESPVPDKNGYKIQIYKTPFTDIKYQK